MKNQFCFWLYTTATRALARVAANVPKTTACLVEKPGIAAPVLFLLFDETVEEEELEEPEVVIPAGRVVLFANPAACK